MKACHIRDGVAMSKFLCWLDAEVAAGNLHDEATLADKLEAFRSEDPTLMLLRYHFSRGRQRGHVSLQSREPT